MRQPQFKFDPLPTESADICLFHERWIKKIYTQPFCQLCVKYGLVFYKNNLVQFCNKYMVGPSQKNSFWARGKWKNDLKELISHNSFKKYLSYINL